MRKADDKLLKERKRKEYNELGRNLTISKKIEDDDVKGKGDDLEREKGGRKQSERKKGYNLKSEGRERRRSERKKGRLFRKEEKKEMKEKQETI